MENNQPTFVHKCADMTPAPFQQATIDEVLIDNLSSGIIFVDDLCFIRCVNSRSEELLGLSRDSVIGKRLDLLPINTPLYRVLSESFGNLPFEISLNGMVIAGKTWELKTADGTVSGELTELHDVTEVKKERKLRKEYIAMMTHDLKSPLTSIIGYAQMLKLEKFGKLDHSFRAPVDNIEVSSYKLLAMIEDIVESYRVEASGLLQLHLKNDNINPILYQCCREKMAEAEALGINFTFRLVDDIPAFSFDGRQILRVFTNLLANAVKFTPCCGNISVNAEMKEKWLFVSIEDSGIGISQEELKQIFTKYYRAANAGCILGTGLGLTISKAIVEAHGGTIEVESRVGRGSRFVVKIPCRNEETLSHKTL